ncbi:vacuolar protein sorting-associated protein 13 [[Candida] railenensis]|uniref:Vacuolar protein sorting-associated protein n=1 Tax=[Candida] railenensis TaxID=45579 RepID=A0A9P0QUH4_9ASCO|nr:vacuolar protein sorting-associated protein 13 [[Candida] railenensis]
MFESLVATILNRFLGSYIEDFDPKQLNIGIWSGDVKLKNLRLKKESLDELKLPLDVKFGHLGELTLQIPWSNLKGQPVKVIIEDVYLLASPIILEDFDLEEDMKKELNVKKEKLKQLEAIEKAQNQNESLTSDLKNNETFTENLITKIVDNLQVTIRNIHVRYEDDSVLTELPYSIGLTLDELSAVSTDNSWLPSFISITQALTHKLLTLKSLSVYMNTDSTSIYHEDSEKLLKEFSEYVEKSNNQEKLDLQYLLRPVTGKGRLTVNKHGATESSPHIKAELFFEEFGVDLDSQQYKDILWTASKFHWYMKTYKFRRLRPKIPVSEDPKRWFKYAAESILNEIHERNYKWTWEYFEKRRDQRKEYVSLWKLHLLGNVLTAEQNERLESLLKELTFEDIKLYRSLASNEVRKENLAIKKAATHAPAKEGWLSGWWRAAPTADGSSATSTGDESDTSMALSDSQKKALYDAIDYDESQEISNAISIPRDRVKIELLATLKKGGISIRSAKNEPNLAEIVFEGCTTQVYQRPDSFLANFQLQEFRVEDGTQTTLYKHIVSVKQSHSHIHSAKDEEKGELQEKENGKNDPFFKISFENNPLDGSADSILLGKLKSMTIFYNPHFIEEVVRFFTPPKIHLDTIGAIMNAAEETMEGLSAQTRLALQYALEEHKTINVKLDLQAPLVFLPLDPQDWKSPVAILDAGHISVVSDLVDKKEIEEFKSKDNYSEKDWNQLNTLMYDQFNIHLQDAQFLVGPDIKTTTEQLHVETDEEGNRSALILDKLNIKLTLGISILPDAYNLAKFKIGGEVPNIKLTLNDFQYKTIMKLIDNAIPNLDDSASTNESVLFDAYGQYKEAKIEEFDSDGMSSKTKKAELSAAALEQHIFEFDFSVDLVNVSLLRCIDGISLEEEPLVDLVGDHLKLFFFKTENDLKLELTLEDINLIDNIEKSGIPEFDKLVSSNNFDQSDDFTNKRQLFKVDYARTLRVVEFNKKSIEVFDQDIDLSIATVKFVISRKSLLSLLNFVLNTFVDPDAPETPADQLKHNDPSNDETSPAKINVNVNMDSIILVLNEDGLKLATLELSTANIFVLVLPEELEVSGKLGALSLHDEVNSGSPRDSILRNLISIEGEEKSLAQFSYKTFDAANNSNPFHTEIEFKTGSLRVNFVEDSFSKIFNYASQFQRMKEIYDGAREAAINQASQIVDANRIKFDILVNAPTIVFPKLVEGESDKYDQLTAKLGELYANNSFVDENVNGLQNLLSMGIRNISVSSIFHFRDYNIDDTLIVQSSDIVEDLDISFNGKYSEQYLKGRPTLIVDGNMPEVDLKLTELQLKYLMSLSDSVSRVLDTSEVVNDDLEDIELDALNANKVMAHNTDIKEKSKKSDVIRDISKNSNNSEDLDIPKDHSKVDFSFKVPSLSLVLYNNTSAASSIIGKQLTSFTLNGLTVSFNMKEDTHFSSDLFMHSFVVKDIREGSANKFREIIPLLKHDQNQFAFSATSDGAADNKNMTLMLSVDSPQMILAMDYIFELQTFVESGLPDEKPNIGFVEDEEDDEDDEDDGDDGKEDLKLDISKKTSNSSSSSDSEEESSLSRIGFSINITSPSVILLADSSKTDTEAVVFKIEQILLTSQNIISLASNNIGLFLCQMDDIETKRLRIIDDFSISFAYDSRGSTDTSFLTSIQASVDPLLVRVSLRDIRLALTIFNNASELYTAAQAKNKSLPNQSNDDNENNFSDDFKKRLSHYAPTIVSNFSTSKSQSNLQKATAASSDAVIIKGEELNVSIGGLRFVLIGDVHELPVLDMNVKPFDIKAINWSTDLSSETHFEPYVNIYNYARSSWEPLVEPWPIAIYASRVLLPTASIMVDVISRKLTEITVSSRSIALLSQVMSLITTDEKIKPRGEDSPYRITNQTGYKVKVWNDKSSDRKVEKEIDDGNSIPWEFEDWKEVRENLDTDKKQGSLGLELLDSPYDVIDGISATGEGEELFVLNPPIDGIHSRLSFEVILGEDNVKTITLRSTILVQNDAENAVDIQVAYSDRLINLTIQPDESKSLPIDSVYNGTYKIKPVTDVSYSWCEQSLDWKTLMKARKGNESGGGIPIKCNASSNSDNSSYYYQVEAVFDSEEPLAKIYPHMKIIISAPVEVENLLPFDLDYRLYDKSSRKDWSGTIAKGVKTFIHVSSLKSLLLLSVEPKDCGYLKSEFAIINAPRESEFKRETVMSTRHETNGQKLRFKIHYLKKKNHSTSLKVVIYSPYVILNKTGQNLTINERGNYLYSKSNPQLTVPSMFSFEKDDDRRNRALIKIGDSAWTTPLSFDAIGQNIAAKAQLNGRQAEMNVGITVNEGEGKYNLTKVVTIAPRYIFRNNLDDDLQIVENGSTKPIVVKSGGTIQTLYALRKIDQKSLLIKFNHSSKPWSAPFSIDDVGQIFIKLYKDGVGQVLLKVNTIIENATIFISVENANNNWPFSIRNFSDSEFYVYQGDPNVNENGDVVRHDSPSFKPIFYKIPAKSVMPYAYDYPNAVIKELYIRSHDRERSVNLAEIGNLRPFRLPPRSQDEKETIVDLNVVADGPTQSLIISNYDPSVSLYKLKNTSDSASMTSLSTNATGESGFEATEKDEYHTKIITKFEGFGISLINTRGQELCYITLRGLEIRYNESQLYQNLSVKLKWIQIDNQLYGGIFPIILYPSVIPKSGKEMNNHPSFSASICKVKDDSHGVLFIKYATVLLQEMTIEIDEDFLFALLDFTKFPGATWNKRQVDVLCDDNLDIPEPRALDESSDIYFEALHLQPTMANLSFVRTERINAEDKQTSQNTLMFFFNVLTMAIGNINDAPIKLNALFIENIRVPIPILVESIQTHYGQAFFYQLHKILGSADFLGNPVGLFNNISSGVLDIFYEPYQGFIINDRPQELGIGIAKGGLSFLKKSIFGFSDSFAKFTGSVAKGLSVVTLDKRFQERRRLNQRRNKPKHALYGLASGANSFFESISSGVTGIATAPIEGASEGGAAGFFKGLGKGVVGLPTKTAIGFFDLASNVSEGIRNTTTVFDAEGLDKVRLPRYISAYDHIIRPFSQREAQGQFWLNAVDGGEYFNEKYLAHLLLPGEEKCILITFKKIFLFQVNSLKSTWVINFENIKSISIEPTGINIGLKNKKEGPFIPIPEKNARSFLYGKIRIAVQEFNKHCQFVL